MLRFDSVTAPLSSKSTPPGGPELDFTTSLDLIKISGKGKDKKEDKHQFTFFSDSSLTKKATVTDEKSKSIIDGEYLRSLTTKLNDNYPKTDPDSPWREPKYPAKDLEWVYIKNGSKNDFSKKYNLFYLRLPYFLQGYESFYNHTKFSDFPLSTGIKPDDAKITYLNFIKQYNSAYITLLHVANGSASSTQLKELFTTNKMFIDANVNISALRDDVQKPNFLFAILAYLTLDIVFSKESSITTAARMNVLNIVKQNFDLEQIATAFDSYSLGYYISDTQNETAFDMIPRRFVTKAEESGGTPHNNLFLKNAKIQEIFQIKSEGYTQTINLDYGISTLLSNHPHEMLQVLHALLRCNSLLINRKLIFSALVSLTKLDHLQKDQLFGANASYRNNGESKRDTESRVGWAMGTESFGDYISESEINLLGPDDLKKRLRQQAYRVYQLESELVDKESASNLRAIDASNDPKGYFAILLLHPNTPPENFDELLNRNYRVLALKFHPDKPTGNREKFESLNEAYVFLQDAKNRKKYGVESHAFGL